jgi:sugar phosphate isomerase/epimerase
MQIGIFTRTFLRPTLAEVLDAVVAHDLRHVQFGLTCAGLPSMPDELDKATCTTIHQALSSRGITVSALSGTFNMIHPHLAQRQQGLRQLGVLITAAHSLGARVITLCTGTRDPDNMWRPHPDNHLPEAWRDLVASLQAVLPLAEAHHVMLGVEPEVSNVVDSAQKARHLLDELGSPHLKIVMDGANLFPAGTLPQMRLILSRAFDLLGDDIVLAHAKDLTHDGEAGNAAAGSGLLDYDHYLALLRAAHYDGPLILHSLSEAQTPTSIAFLRLSFSYHSLTKRCG